MSRVCNHCGVLLCEDTWCRGNVKKNNYICRICDAIKAKRNRLRRQALQIGRDVYRQYSKVKSGYVYVITNPAWPEWVKVGMAIDVDDRCTGYQTSSPFRDYEVQYSFYSRDRRKAERKAHRYVGKQSSERKGEWFRISAPVAVSCIINASVNLMLAVPNRKTPPYVEGVEL
tara:strand:- start:88 stop:603 length:516 start_codon:yes stop_codon:yes gene_type:complete